MDKMELMEWIKLKKKQYVGDFPQLWALTNEFEKELKEKLIELKEKIPNEVIDPETNTEFYTWEEVNKIFGESKC